MISSIENIIKNNKSRLERLEVKIKLAKNEYNEAFVQGMIDQLEMTIYELENVVKENRQKEIDKSWETNPDRMCGHYTSHEIIDDIIEEWR